MKGKKSAEDKFENIAKELECDESDDALDKVMDKLDLEAEEEGSEEE